MQFSRAAALAFWMLASTGCLAPASAWAHRFGGPNDPCERKIGSSFIHITLYQPQFDPDAEYCQEVPREGNTVLVVDVLGEELRKVPIGLDVIATGPSQVPRTILSVPPTLYRRGVADAQLMLTARNRYLARISLEGKGIVKSQVLSFPITVGSWYRALIVPFLIIAGVVMLTAISVIRYYLSGGASRFPMQGAEPRNVPMTIKMLLPHPARSLVRVQTCLLSAALLFCLAIAACQRKLPASNPALLDITVIDDHGRPLSLGSLKGKVVLLEFIHIGCPGVCDTLVSKFGRIADTLGPDLGSKVVLLSVTNDPENDTPAKLLQLARSREADLNGWLFVTGNVRDVNRVISAFGLHNERLPDGSPNHITQVFLLGPDLQERQKYPGMAMDLHSVEIAIKETLERSGAS